jgi:hypothetical protein
MRELRCPHSRSGGYTTTAVTAPRRSSRPSTQPRARRCDRRRRSHELLKFLRTIDRNAPAQLDSHRTLNNYATHKTPALKRWLNKHLRFQLHITIYFALLRSYQARIPSQRAKPRPRSESSLTTAMLPPAVLLQQDRDQSLKACVASASILSTCAQDAQRNF